MSHTNPDQIIAHVDLLRAVDRLLSEAQTVRKKREILELILTGSSDNQPDSEAGRDELVGIAHRKRGQTK